MNTGQKNTKGRTIYRGPRGGEYVVGPNGQKIRTFKKTTAASTPTPATGNKNTLGRKIYRGPRGGEYVMGAGGKKIRKFKKVAVPDAVLKRLSKYLKLSNNLYVSKDGTVYDGQGKRVTVSLLERNDILREAFKKNPKYIYTPYVPYLRAYDNNMSHPTKLGLTDARLALSARNSRNLTAKLFFNKNGGLYYVSLAGKKLPINSANTLFAFRVIDNKRMRNLKRLAGEQTTTYPRTAIPPISPRPRRSSPDLLENIVNQIFTGGRGKNIDASRYTPNERNVLISRISNYVKNFKDKRNAKKAEAVEARAVIRGGATGDVLKSQKALIAAANERIGYYDDAVRAYTRALRALKPLTGAITPRARAMAATPDRFSPAPSNVAENIIYMPLERPHIVVKTPGVGVAYLNPNTFRGLLKNSARVNVPEANIRDWLRMARRDFPDEPLFRHPLAAGKNVTAAQMRFSRS